MGGFDQTDQTQFLMKAYDIYYLLPCSNLSVVQGMKCMVHISILLDLIFRQTKRNKKLSEQFLFVKSDFFLLKWFSVKAKQIIYFDCLHHSIFAWNRRCGNNSFDLKSFPSKQRCNGRKYNFYFLHHFFFPWNHMRWWDDDRLFDFIWRFFLLKQRKKGIFFIIPVFFVKSKMMWWWLFNFIWRFFAKAKEKRE